MRAPKGEWFGAAASDIARGVRGGVATLVPFFLANELGRRDFAWMAIGGWLGTLVDPGGLRRARAKTLIAFALAGAAAVAVSVSVSPSRALATFVLTATAFAVSLLRPLGATWSTAGTLITVVVAIGSASGGEGSARDGVFFATGAGWAVVLSSIVWPVFVHSPMRRAVANVFEQLSVYVRELAAGVAADAPEGDARWTAMARQRHRSLRNVIEGAAILSVEGRSRRSGESRIGGNLRVLLGMADAQFRLLITLSETLEVLPPDERRRVATEPLADIAATYDQIPTSLVSPFDAPSPAPQQRGRPPASGVSRAPAEALVVQVTDAAKVALSLARALDAAPDSDEEAIVFPASSPMSDTTRAIRANLRAVRDALSPKSTAFRHALRVACATLAASLIGFRLSSHPHWVTITTVAVLQPYPGATVQRAAHRVVGTVLGSVIAVIVTMTIHAPIVLAAIMFPLSVAAVATQRRSYGLFTFFLTPVFVLLAERFQGDWWTAAGRAGDAVVGGAIALVAAVLIFPSREATRLPDVLGAMLDAVASYAQVVLASLADRHAAGTDARVQASRRVAGIALAEAETSLERLLAEPLRGSRAMDGAHALELVTYARRSASALTALDTAVTARLYPNANAVRAVPAIAEYVQRVLGSAAAFARDAVPKEEPPAPSLPSDLEPHARAAFDRLLRHVALVAGAASRARTVPEDVAKPAPA